MKNKIAARWVCAGVVSLLLGVGLTSASGDTNLPASAPADPMAGVKRIVFTGNSLTDGSAWCDWVIETLQANGYPNLIMYNAGVAGNSTEILKARYTKDVLEVKPDLVIINIGTVDNKPVENYRRDLGAMVAATRETGAKMVLMTPAPIRNISNKTYRAVAYAPVVRELAEKYGCLVADTQAAFAEEIAAGKEVWGPDGIHHKIDGWRALARVTLDTLGCRAPLVEKTSLYYQAVTNWYIGPSIAWTNAAISIPLISRQWSPEYNGPTIAWSNSARASAPSNSAPVVLKNMPPDYDPIAASIRAYPPVPEIPPGFNPLKAGWRRFDAAAEIAKTSWWQKCWLERGGVMPMGQAILKDKPGVPSRDAGAFALAIVRSDREMQSTLHVGGSPPYAVWVNGKMVWNGQFLHGYHPSADRIKIALHKGENQILVFTNWLFYISLGEI